MMEPSEYKERNVIEDNFIRNINVYVRRQDATKKEMSLGKNNKNTLYFKKKFLLWQLKKG